MFKSKLIRIAALLLAFLMIFSTAEAFADDDEGEKSEAERAEEIRREIQNSKVGHYGMVPIHGIDVEDGEYDIVVESSSPFFKVRKARLKVENGEMTATITINSTSYLYVFLGRKGPAKAADESEWIAPEVIEGRSEFTFRLDALNKKIDCAAYSKARRKWYDRVLVFDADSLPEGALKIDLPDYGMIDRALEAYMPSGDSAAPVKPKPRTSGTVEAMKIDRQDGEYSIEVNLIGGSGRASISSPTLLIVRDGKAYARLIWSSTYYDYMMIDDDTYLNLTTDGGNSVFEIPIPVMDEPISVIADTTAMGDPLEIEYALTFYEDTIGTKGQIPQEAAKLVLLIAAVIIVGGGIINYFVKKKHS